MQLPAVTYLRLEKDGCVIVDMHVIPNASRTQADGTHDGALRVRLHAPPVDGKANVALCAWLADTLKIAKSHIELVRGHTAKRKQWRISRTVSQGIDWSALAGG